MSKSKEKNGYKTFIMFAGGIFMLLVGVTSILVWWADVVSLVRGGFGIVLAVGGLLVMYTVKK